jgi:hypothetical protein
LGNSRNSPLSYSGWHEIKPYFWEEDKNFQELKKWLCIGSVLSLPEIGKPYEIYINISEEGGLKWLLSDTTEMISIIGRSSGRKWEIAKIKGKNFKRMREKNPIWMIMDYFILEINMVYKIKELLNRKYWPKLIGASFLCIWEK